MAQFGWGKTPQMAKPDRFGRVDTHGLSGKMKYFLELRLATESPCAAGRLHFPVCQLASLSDPQQRFFQQNLNLFAHRTSLALSQFD
jgi:hypothetical protein